MCLHLPAVRREADAADRLVEVEVMEDSSRSKADEQGAAIYDNKHNFEENLEDDVSFLCPTHPDAGKNSFHIHKKNWADYKHTRTQPWNPVRR